MVPCSHATPPSSEMLRDSGEGQGAHYWSCGRAQPWGSRPWTNMAAFSSMAASLSLSSSLARCRLRAAGWQTGCTLYLHTIRYAPGLSGRPCAKASLLMCVPGEAESEHEAKESTITAQKPPPPPPPARLSSASMRVSIRVFSRQRPSVSSPPRRLGFDLQIDPRPAALICPCQTTPKHVGRHDQQTLERSCPSAPLPLSPSALSGSRGLRGVRGFSARRNRGDLSEASWGASQ